MPKHTKSERAKRSTAKKKPVRNGLTAKGRRITTSRGKNRKA